MKAEFRNVNTMISIDINLYIKIFILMLSECGLQYLEISPLKVKENYCKPIIYLKIKSHK